MNRHYDFIVIGAGIVGLATALKILEHQPSASLLVLEKEKDIAMHQTGNNSGIIHSGIYYKPGSLKATNCRKGYEMLLDFCNTHDVKYEISGKVIVAANEEELTTLDKLYQRGVENGLDGLEILDSKELNKREPYAKGLKAVFVPQTGRVNYYEVAKKYFDVIKNNGGTIKFNNDVKTINQDSEQLEIKTQNNTFNCNYLISCAGLFSDRIAKLTHPELPLRIIPFRGEYYKIKESKRYLVNSLIYPVPDDRFPFLGVHFTKMINGEVEVGPNAVLAFKREGYKKTNISLNDLLETFSWPGFHKVAAKYWKTGFGEFYRSYSKNAFVKALQKMVPAITGEDIEPGGAGVRAQACDKDGGLLDDFYFVEDKNILHVCNAPSPAATASLAIGEYIAKKIISGLN